MKKLFYAQERLNLVKSEMGSIVSLIRTSTSLSVEFENGMNLQLHDDEIKHQAIEYLESEIESVNH